MEAVEGGGEAGSPRLEGLGSDVDSRLVRTMGGGAQPEGGRAAGPYRGNNRRGRRHTERLHDGVRQVWSHSEALGFAVARADAGREADAERLSALIKALTGREPGVRRRSDGAIEVVYSREHLESFMRYAELAEAVERWLEEARR